MKKNDFADSKKTYTGLLKESTLMLCATSGDSTGEIDLAWEPVSGAYSYIIQKSSGPSRPGKWIVEDVVTKSSCTVSKLKSRHNYWFRAAPVKVKGQGQWSKPIQKKAP